MSGYQEKKKIFGLTHTKMEKWHSKSTHLNLSKKECPICNFVDMNGVADYLAKNGFKVVRVGNAFVEIDAPSPSFEKMGMTTTKEIDNLYRFLAG